MNVFAEKKKFNFLAIIFVLSFILAGGFHEEVSCLLSLLLSLRLLFYAFKNKYILFKINAVSIACSFVFGFYILSCIWAVDSGMAVFGIIKYLPVFLFLLCLMQNEDIKEVLISYLPYIAVGLTVVSAVLMQISALKSYFSVSGRFSGCFQYPNTFAAFLLISELSVFAKEKLKLFDFLLMFVLLFGIFYTGSRTVFILMIISNIAMVFVGKRGKLKLIFGAAGIICIIGVIVYTLISGNNIFGRLLNISLKESTFVGRILYFKDSIPLIAKHPFGLGYNGYYYIQQTVQTGVYLQKHVHNDFLQTMLDIGWLPFLLLIYAVIKKLLCRKTSIERKIILITFVLHSSFDFNLQFTAMYFIFILLLYTNSDKEYKLGHKNVLVAVSCAVILFNLYFSAVVMCFRFGAYGVADKLYPYYTENTAELLKKAETAEEMEALADRILKQNKYLPLAYSAKSRVSFSKGDFEKLVEYKHKVFENAPYVYSDYEEYCYMLINAISMYTQAGDTYSVNFCRNELIRTFDTVKALPDTLSTLGKMIDTKPRTLFPDDITDYVKALKAEK